MAREMFPPLVDSAGPSILIVVDALNGALLTPIGVLP